MTVSKTLARGKTRNGKKVVVLESYEKFSSVPHYEIVISEENSIFAEQVIKTAKTTWRKKFKELTV